MDEEKRDEAGRGDGADRRDAPEEPSGVLYDLAAWRARRAARLDVSMGVPPFVLEERCPGCGEERVSTMVWRRSSSEARPRPFPRIAPHFLCRDGRVVWQDITDSPLRPRDWTTVLGHFDEAEGSL